MTDATKVAPQLSDEQLNEFMNLVKGADSVELKLTVADTDRRSAIEALGLDPLEAQIRQVYFFDTPGLDLNRSGVVVRARRVQKKGGDSTVKLRPVEPPALPQKLRSSKNLTVEVDAMPGSFVCSASLKNPLGMTDVKEVATGARSIRKLFSKEQRDFYTEHAPAGLELDSLMKLGPINVFKLRFAPEGFGRSMVAELWMYPDDSRILELSTKCAPVEAFQTVAESRVFLSDHGIERFGVQATKTKTALEYYAKQLASAPA
jgi:hypothetical protein